MIELIKEIEIAKKCKLYKVALVSALTLPDICGKVQSKKDSSNRNSYVKWFNDFVWKHYDKISDSKIAEVKFDGEVCYSLRCAALHSGNLNIMENNAKDKVGIQEFTLNVYSDGTYLDKYTLGSKTEGNICKLDVRCLIENLCNEAISYYDTHPDKSLFEKYQYSIINWS